MAEDGKRSKWVARLREAGFVLLLCVLSYAHYEWAIEPIRQLLASDNPTPASAIGESKEPQSQSRRHEKPATRPQMTSSPSSRTDLKNPKLHSKGDKGKRDEKPSEHWWGNPDWWVAGFTGVLLFIAYPQMRMFQRQLVFMRIGLRDAKKASEAANESAIAAKQSNSFTLNAQRPWLSLRVIPRVNIVTEGWRDVASLQRGRDISGFRGGEEYLSLNFSVEIHNIGLSPAFDVTVGSRLRIFDVMDDWYDVPDKLTYISKRMQTHEEGLGATVLAGKTLIISDEALVHREVITNLINLGAQDFVCMVDVFVLYRFNDKDGTSGATYTVSDRNSSVTGLFDPFEEVIVASDLVFLELPVMSYSL